MNYRNTIFVYRRTPTYICTEFDNKNFNPFVVPVSGTANGFSFCTGLYGSEKDTNLSPYYGMLHRGKCSLKKEARNHGGRFSKSIFQTYEHGVYVGTFETELIQSSKCGKTDGISLPSQSNSNLNQ